MSKERGSPLTSVGIKAVIKAVRSELLSAYDELKASGEDPVFVVETFLLEMQCVVTRDSKLDGGLKLGVVTVGGETSYKSDEIHKLQILMKPSGTLFAGFTGERPSISPRGHATERRRASPHQPTRRPPDKAVRPGGAAHGDEAS
jgi:hypothetical protein